MDTSQQKTVAGVVLIVLSSILLFVVGLVLSLPLALAGVATAGLAAGSWLIGTSEEGRPV